MTATQLENMEVTVPATLVAQIEGLTCKPDDPGTVISGALGRLYGAINRAGLTPTAPPRVIYTEVGPDEMRFTVAAPVDRSSAAPMGQGISIAMLPERPALRFVHRGPYAELERTYAQIESWLRERGGMKTHADWARYSPMWEEYLNDPTTTPESELLTHIFLPLNR